MTGRWSMLPAVITGCWSAGRCSLNEKGEKELAYFCCYAPRGATLAELVAVAGARWAVEDCFAEAKNETGLDHYQVRLYQAWYRHITLSMLAHAFLAVTAHALRPGPVPPDPPPASAGDSQPAVKRGAAACGQVFRPPRTYSPPQVITDENGEEMIPLTAAETRRLFNLYTRVTRPEQIPRALVRLASPPPGPRRTRW